MVSKEDIRQAIISKKKAELKDSDESIMDEANIVAKRLEEEVGDEYSFDAKVAVADIYSDPESLIDYKASIAYLPEAKFKTLLDTNRERIIDFFDNFDCLEKCAFNFIEKRELLLEALANTANLSSIDEAIENKKMAETLRQMYDHNITEYIKSEIAFTTICNAIKAVSS